MSLATQLAAGHLTLARMAVEDVETPRGQRHFAERVIEVVAERTGIARHRILGAQRPQTIYRARMIAVHVLYDVAGLSSTVVGYRLGDRDHTTILHAANRARDLLRTDSGFASDVQHVTAEVSKWLTK